MDTNMGDAELQLIIPEFVPPKRREHVDLQEDALEKFLKLLNTPNKDDETLKEFNNLLHGKELNRLQFIYDSWKDNECTSANVSECRSFLSRSSLQKVLAKMLENIADNAEYLKSFISHFNAYNECIEPQYLPGKKGKSSEGKRETVRELDSPLHCAVRQLDGTLIDWLLGNPIEVNLRNKSKETALALLCIRYDDVKQRLKQPAASSVEQKNELKIVKSFIQKLLAKGADFNIYTCVPLAFDILWKHRTDSDSEADEFVDDIIKNNTGAIAKSSRTKRSKEDEAGNEAKEGKDKEPTRAVELVRRDETQDNLCTVELLEIFLRFNDIEKFKNYWETFEVTDANVKIVTTLLLHTAVDKKQNSFVKKIMDKAERMIFKHMDMAHLKGLLKKPCLSGDPYSLKIILNCIPDQLLLTEVPLLVTTVNRAHRAKNAQERNFLGCAKVLIENCKKVPIHATDNDGNTALHLALRYGYEKLALLMLEKQHGLLELRNRRNQTPVDCGTLKFWESFLDNCITTKDRTVMRLNVAFLRPIEKEKTTPAPRANAAKVVQGSCCRPWSWPDSWKILQPVKEVHNSKCLFTHTATEMTVLRLIAQSKERKQLLLHPTLTSFVMLKWMRLCHWNMLNLLLTTFTMLCFGAYTLMSCSNDGYTAWSWLPRILAGVGALVLTIREFMQWFLLRWSYVTLENVSDIFTIILMIAVLFCGCERGSWSFCGYVPICSSFVVVSLALQASFLLGALSINRLATTLYMFKTVSRNFFYSFLLFTPLIGSFVYGFYLTNNVSPNGVIDYCTSENCSEENFNNFRSFWNATIKTLVMTTGEFEAANVDFEGGKMLLFIGFVFLAPIVILNLINGLAVSDIAAIREESKLISICKKVKQLERYERGVVKFLSCLGDTRTTSKTDQSRSSNGSISPVPGNSLSIWEQLWVYWNSGTDTMRTLFRKSFFPGSFFEEHEPAIFIATNELNKLGLVAKTMSDKKNSVTSPKEQDSNSAIILMDRENEPNNPTIENDPNNPGIEKDSNNSTSEKNQNNKLNQKRKSNIQPIPILPGLPKSWLEWCFKFRSYQKPLFVTLDGSCVNEAMAIVGKRYAASSTDESIDLADTELAVTTTVKNKVAIKRQKPIKSSAPPAAAGPAGEQLDLAGAKRAGTSTVKSKTANRLHRSSEPTTDPRDMQIKLLQEQMNTILQVMGDVKQELQAKRNCVCENQQRVEDHAIADNTALGQAGDA
uniref:Ion transport domain-containing protein n=1 Tax=Anopheles atroparvus TaxID=41427 RepID=A0AAG5DFB1_ANOAO